MTGFDLLVVGSVATWLFILSVALLITVRQVAILNVHLERANQSSQAFLENDGPELGASISELIFSDSVDLKQTTCLLFASVTCTSCRELIVNLGNIDQLKMHTILFLIGRDDLVAPLIELVPEYIEVICDPIANQFANGLSIQSIPFGIISVDGRVQSKSYIFSIQTILQLTDRFVSVN